MAQCQFWELRNNLAKFSGFPAIPIFKILLFRLAAKSPWGYLKIIHDHLGLNDV